MYVYSTRSWGLKGEQSQILPCPCGATGQVREKIIQQIMIETHVKLLQGENWEEKLPAAVRACNEVQWQVKDGFTVEVLIKLKSESGQGRSGRKVGTKALW